MFRALLISIFIFSGIYSKAAITRATADGNWNTGGIWTNGQPACGDTIIIDSGVTVEVTVSVDLDENSGCSIPIHLEIYGTLEFKTGKKMYLPCNSFVSISGSGSLDKGNGGGNSNVIDICQTTVWNAGDGSQDGPTGFGTGTPLPITLLNFSVQVQNSYVEISWITVSEINNHYFTVERSLDAINFEEIAQIQGAGNSSEILHYSMADDNPISGTSYYRLKQTDFDGSFTYSSTKAARIDMKEVEVTLFPNPTSQFFAIKTDAAVVEVRILDRTGRLMHTYGMTAVTSNLSVTDLSPGIYMVQVIMENDVITERLVKQ